ncbi:hypothetical protein BKA80DRAFT_278236 [Phyllosticta citrichinensis]
MRLSSVSNVTPGANRSGSGARSSRLFLLLLGLLLLLAFDLCSGVGSSRQRYGLTIIQCRGLRSIFGLLRNSHLNLALLFSRHPFTLQSLRFLLLLHLSPSPLPLSLFRSMLLPSQNLVPLFQQAAALQDFLLLTPNISPPVHNPSFP